MKINKFESQQNIKIHDLQQRQQEVKNDVEFSGKIKSFAQEAKKVCIFFCCWKGSGNYGISTEGII